MSWNRETHHREREIPAVSSEWQEARIRELMERAEQQDRDLAATFHELRTPVTNIMGFAETLQAGMAAGNPEKTARFLGIIATQAARMAKLLDDLQTLMELESGRRCPVMEPISLDTAVSRALEQSAGQLSSRRVTLRCEVPGNTAVIADPDLLHLVLVHLLANAITATPDGGCITVAAGTVGDEVVVTVEDTGAGIPPQELTRVFDRFHRVDVARSRAGGGNGLGLTLAREIVRRHGGDVTLESSPGRGTTAALRLPVTPPKESAGRFGSPLPL